MPATYTAQHLRSRAARVIVEHDVASADDPQVVALTPTADCFAITDGYRRFLAGLFRSVGTGNIDAFEIIAATDAAGTGATVVVEHAFATEADAVGDFVWLECDIEQVLEVLATATHVGVRIEQATAGDECIVYFERAEPTFAYTDLTADTIV
jgi:hypothetical protein